VVGKSWFSQLKSHFRKGAFKEKITQIWGSSASIAERKEHLETLLIEANFGLQFTDFFMESFSKRDLKNVSPQDVQKALAQKINMRIASLMGDYHDPLNAGQRSGTPWVMMLVGVNGSGKTTTAGKLAAFYAQKGLSVMLAGADLFRAGADLQAEEWAKRAGVAYFSSQHHTNSSGFVFDALSEAENKKSDVMLLDTAGRLHNHSNLMDELSKIHRVLRKKNQLIPQACVLVMDSTLGQNAEQQMKLFSEHLPLTGFMLTKFDGTARPGFVVKLFDTFNIPLLGVGTGEGVKDLETPCAENISSFLSGLLTHT